MSALKQLVEHIVYEFDLIPDIYGLDWIGLDPQVDGLAWIVCQQKWTLDQLLFNFATQTNPIQSGCS